MLPASLSARWMPHDLVEASKTGGVFTLIAYAVMLAIFLCELHSALRRDITSSLRLDSGHPEFQVNLDVQMSAIACRNLRVAAEDNFGRPIPVERDFMLVPPDDPKAPGMRKQGFDEEELEKRALSRGASAAAAELHPDWARSDLVKDQIFSQALQAQEYTLVVFGAEWSTQCKDFEPTWQALSELLRGDKKFADQNGQEKQVVPIKVNCEQSPHVCSEQTVEALPTIQLFRSDGHVQTYAGPREPLRITTWIGASLRNSRDWHKQVRNEQKGCAIRGWLRLPRTSGHLDIVAGAGDQDLLPSAANTTHRIQHLSFTVPREHHSKASMTWGVPQDARADLNPLDKREFHSRAANQVFEHHLRLVSMMTTTNSIAYPFAHYGHSGVQGKEAQPKVRFHFDVEPFAIQVAYDEKEWYDVATSLLACLGGVFVLLRLASKAVLFLVVLSTSAGAKNGAGGRNGLLT